MLLLAPQDRHDSTSFKPRWILGGVRGQMVGRALWQCYFEAPHWVVEFTDRGVVGHWAHDQASPEAHREERCEVCCGWHNKAGAQNLYGNAGAQVDPVTRLNLRRGCIWERSLTANTHMRVTLHASGEVGLATQGHIHPSSGRSWPVYTLAFALSVSYGLARPWTMMMIRVVSSCSLPFHGLR